MSIYIPGVTYKFPANSENYYVRNMSCYIAGIYRYFASVAGILATAMIMYGGYKYVVSFGSPQKISEAKDIIVSAMIGLVITLGSYAILYFINPNLTTLKVPGIDTIRALYHGTNWCTGEAVPKETDQNKCGHVGIYQDGTECVFNDCTYIAEAYTQCFPKNPTEYQPGDEFQCIDGKEACQSLNESVKDWKQRKQLCGYYTTTPAQAGPVSGVCQWGGDSAGLRTCLWRYWVHCPVGYERAPCSECNAAKLDRCYKSDLEHFIDADRALCDETIPPTENVHEGQASAKEGGPGYYIRTAICCKGTAVPPNYQCVSAHLGWE